MNNPAVGAGSVALICSPTFDYLFHYNYHYNFLNDFGLLGPFLEIPVKVFYFFCVVLQSMASKTLEETMNVFVNPSFFEYRRPNSLLSEDGSVSKSLV